MITFVLVLCLGTLIQSLPIANPSSDSVLIDYKADSHSRYEEGTPGKSVQGSYSWTSEDKVYQVDYTADENGYRPRLTIKSVSEAEQKPIAQQDSVQIPVVQNEAEIVTPVKEVGSDAISLEIPARDEFDAIVPVEDPLADAIVLDIPLGGTDSQPMFEQEAIKVTPGTLIMDLIAEQDEFFQQPAPLQVSPQSEAEKMQSNKVGNDVKVKIPVASSLVVQQDLIQVKPQKVEEELKPDKLVVAQEVVVEAPVQSDPLTQPDNSQAQFSSQYEPSVVEQEKVVANEAFVIEIPYESDVNAQEEGQSQDDVVKQPEIDTSEIYDIPPVFNFQYQQEPADDEIYTDDAVIIDAAGDLFSSDSTQDDGGNGWGKADSQDEASDFLNAMLQEYLNQFYGNSKQQVQVEENRRSKIGDYLYKSDPYYFNQEVPEKDDFSAVVEDYQRMSPQKSLNDDEYVVSFDDLYENFYPKEYRAQSKVDDSIQDQGHTDDEVETAFRVLMGLAEEYSQQPYSIKKQNSKFESGNHAYDYVFDESFLREFYYQQWLNAQKASQQEATYYAIYPNSAYYYR